MYSKEASWPILEADLNGVGFDELEVCDLIIVNTRLKICAAFRGTISTFGSIIEKV